MLFNHPAQIKVVDDKFSHASVFETFYLTFDERLAPNLSRGLVNFAVSGCIRSPRPAASIIARMVLLAG